MSSSRSNLVDELIPALESLPSYRNLQDNQDESAIFNEETETASGLINLIRKNSQTEQGITPLPTSVRIHRIRIRFSCFSNHIVISR